MANEINHLPFFYLRNYKGGGANGGGTEFNTVANSGNVEAAAQPAMPAFQTNVSLINWPL